MTGKAESMVDSCDTFQPVGRWGGDGVGTTVLCIGGYGRGSARYAFVWHLRLHQPYDTALLEKEPASEGSFGRSREGAFTRAAPGRPRKSCSLTTSSADLIA